MVPVLLAQFGQSAFGDEASGGDHPDPVGHSFGDFKNMRGHDHGAAGANAIAEQSLDVARRDRVEPGERFVQDDQARLMYQGSRQRDLLAHAFGETPCWLSGWLCVRSSAIHSSPSSWPPSA